MKHTARILLLLLLPFFVKAQNTFYKTVSRQLADSFRKELKMLADDTLRMLRCRDLSNYYSEMNFDSSLYYGNQVFELAAKLDFPLWKANGLYAMALSFTRFGNYPKALESYSAARKIAEDQNSEKAIPHIEYFTANNDPHHARLIVLANIIQDLGSLYSATGNKEMEIATRREAIQIAESISDNTTISVAYANLSNVYFSRGNTDSAYLLNRRAMEYADAAGFEYYKGFSYALNGYVYLGRSKNDSAAYFFKKGVQKSLEQNTYTALAANYLGLGRLLKRLGQVDSSIFYAQQALALLDANISQRELAGLYGELARYYEMQKKPDSAIRYLNRSIELNEKASNAEKENLRKYQAMGFDEQLRFQDLEKEKIATENKTRTYVLLSGLGVFFAIGLMLYRNNRQKQKANKVLEAALADLKSTQTQLIQSEKMASLGELTAGIAHEIQNPLNFVNNFAEVNSELIADMKDELDKRNTDTAKAIAIDIDENEKKIIFHGKRADGIVKGMLQHSRSSNGKKEATGINELVDEYLRLSYHGLRAKDKSFNASFRTDLDNNTGKVNIIPQEIGRVLLNLINNAFYSVNEKKRQDLPGYEPTVTVTTKKLKDKIEISVKDNGGGIPQKIKDKIFQPFFTTKPKGQGTGLGLSMAYDIITKGHNGEINVETKEGEGTAFVIHLPAN